MDMISQEFCTLTLATFISLFSLFTVSAIQCTFQSCPTRNVQLTEGDPPLTLPCNINTPINTSSTTTGNYTYCYNATVLVPQSNSSYTIENIDYTLDRSKICCFDNEAQSCAGCYSFSVYYKPRNTNNILQCPTPIVGEQYTLNCEVMANPLPVCKWRRFTPMHMNLSITSDAIFSNNNCTIMFNRLQAKHNGDYFCYATNFLGTVQASCPTINIISCIGASTQIDNTVPSVVTASIGDPVDITCSVGSTELSTIVVFIFNHTCYFDDNESGTLFPDVGFLLNYTSSRDDCSVQTTLTILQFREEHIGQYSCQAIRYDPSFLEGDNVTFLIEVATLETEESSSSDNTGVFVGVSLGVLFALLSVITITVILLAVTRRWIMTSILRLPPPPCSTDLYQYDLFISHAQDTDDFVNTALRKGLMEKGYRVQTPADFVAGHASDINIINAFMSSRYVMIMFSAEYDHNCSELRYAYNKVDETNYNCLIPVKCGGVIPAKLERITYADYDNDDVVSRVEQTIGKPLYGA